MPSDTQPAQAGAQKRADLSQGEVVPGSRYSSTEVDRGLIAVALCDGSPRRAERLLGEQGEPISESTLRGWKGELYADRYLELQAKALPRLNALAAERHAELATKAGDLNLKMLDRLEDVYEEIPARDLSGAARNVATVAGIHADKSAILRGQGTAAPTPTRSVADILSALKARGVTLTVEVGPGPDTSPSIEGTAQEQRPGE